MSGDAPVTRVFHDIEGAWQFHGPNESKPEEVAYVCFHYIVDRYASIKGSSWWAWKEKCHVPVGQEAIFRPTVLAAFSLPIRS
ncbi:MAG: hypothetical protein JWO91_577 [Acidobacteriaceae bacterium]|nr:hypothetical protein [Acidobacteriaceae bacterium]